ncbi:MAG: metal ABC transporter ATP-binding protein [Proteobacteria bacterium]|nr:metal ABC transporter ATP-binding protein [Pseudomonadota bacterium]
MSQKSNIHHSHGHLHSSNHGHGHTHSPDASIKSPTVGNDQKSPWIFKPESTAKRSMEWDNVSFQYGGRQVVDGITSWLCQGELTCICGSNGAGKTQLLRLGLGLIKPTCGVVKYDGSMVSPLKRNIAYVPQQKNINRNFPATVIEVLIAAYRGAWPLSIRKVERDLAATMLQRLGSLNLLDKDVGVLSGGELQRVFIARALITDPQILILDEPMAAVDSKGRQMIQELMMQLKSDQKMTIALITHSDTIVEMIADRVMFLEKGKLVGWGLPSQVMNVQELREVAFFGHDHEGVIDGGEG